MRTFNHFIAAALLAVLSSGCYHAVVVTGAEPSTETVEEKWVTGFVYGLVIPDELDVANDCPNGVATVETKVSFINQIVTGLTGGIYSPMHVKVTCAAGVRTADKAAEMEGWTSQQVVASAIETSAIEDRPVQIRVLRR